MIRSFLALAFLAALLLPAAAAEEQPVSVEVVANVTQFKPGEPFLAGVLLEIEEGWHIYCKDPGPEGLPTVVEWELPEGVEAGPVMFPPTVTFYFFGKLSEGYRGRVFLWSVIETPAEFEGPLEIKARVSWGACKDLCVPGESEASLVLPAGDRAIAAENAAALFGEIEGQPDAQFEADQWVGIDAATLTYFLLLGFIGGFILNFMPCVLPVIGLRILGFVQQSNNKPRLIRRKGWAFTAGVLVSFWVLAGLVGILQAAGHAVGHGFQFQNLTFLIGITSLVFVLGLSMLGVFFISIGGKSRQGLEALTERGGLSGSFLAGTLATILATPCTAPALGTALGFAFAKPLWVIFAVFTFIGLGLAAPFILLAHRPAWIRKLPKPGPWMEYFKQAMGFTMLAVVVWLLSIIAYHGADAVVWTVAFLLSLGLAAWIYGTFHAPHRGAGSRRIAKFAVLGLVVGGWLWILEGQINWRGARADTISTGNGGVMAEGQIPWKRFTPENLEIALATDRPVFVNFTARWCITCIINTHSSLEIASTRELIQETGAIPIKADWTHQDDDITRVLREHGRAAIPFYLLYGRDRDNPIILPRLLTPRIVADAIHEAARSFESGAGE